MSQKHWIVVNADDTGSAVFTKKSQAFEERASGQRVRECECSDPASHIDQHVAFKWQHGDMGIDKEWLSVSEAAYQRAQSMTAEEIVNELFGRKS